MVWSGDAIKTYACRPLITIIATIMHYLKAPFKALKHTAHRNNSTTKTGDNLVQMRINK